MALSSFLVFFILSRLVVLNNAQETNQSNHGCPVSFPCGSLGRMFFPFAKASQPECGLCTVDCNTTSPKIQLETDGPWYEAKRMLRNDTVLVLDPDREHLLKSQICGSFYNITLPYSPSISYTFFPNITLLKCNKNPAFTQWKNENFNSNHTAYEGCPEFNVFHSNSYPSNLPPYCSVIQLPRKVTESRFIFYPNDLEAQLTAEFSLQLHVSKECSDCYFDDGGLCKTVSGNKFQCDKGQGIDNGQGLIQNRIEHLLLSL